MNIPEQPKSKLTRAGIATLAIWISAAIFIVLVNRYRNGSEWDSITDLFLLALFLPASLLSLGVASWAIGRRAALAALGIALAGVAASVGWSTYHTHRETKAAQAAEARSMKHSAQRETTFGARCASEKLRAKSGNIDPYQICLRLEAELEANKNR